MSRLDSDRLDYSTSEAARRLGVSRRQIYRLIHQGPLEAYRGAGGRLWIRRQDLAAFRVG